MNTLVIGIIAGVILTLFCMFCIDADAAVSDARMLEAWEEEWREEWEKRRKT